MSLSLRIGKFVSVAALSAASDWIVFSVLVSVLGAPHLPSLMAARVCGGLMSFLSNRHWTWDANRHIALSRQGRRFLVLYAFSYALSVGVFSVLNGMLAWPAYPAKLTADGLCFLLNFVIMHTYVYHRRDGLRALPGRLWRPAARSP